MGLTRITAQQISNIDYKQSVRVVAVSNVTLAGGAPATVDGVSLVAGDRVLVTGQSTGSQNGLYYVVTLGVGSNGTWSRSLDGDGTGEIDSGMIVMVTEGTVYADTQWKLITDDPITVGTTALTFVQNYSANSISSGTSNIAVSSSANVSIAVAGSNVAVFASTGEYVTGLLSVTGNVTGGNLLTGAQVVASGVIQTGTGFSTGGYLSVDGDTDLHKTNVTGNLSATGNITGGNLITTGLVSATGNITGNYILGNGALLTGVITSVANINNGTSNVTVVSSGGNVTVGVGGTSNVAVLANTGVYVTGLSSASGNITGGNINTAGVMSATGNITANYFIGNGSQLTSISTTSISNGTSNVSIASASANVTVGVNGDANTVVISPGSIFVNGLFASPKTITSNVQMAADSTAAVISPLTIGNGYNMSIPTSSTVYVWIPS